MVSQECGVCKKPASQCCSNCNQTFYCSREHQKSDWKNHKGKCAPYKMCVNDTLGRHLVATRDIKAGELVMKKRPLALGPKTASHPACLGCHKRLTNVASLYRCTRCKWPMCGATCETSPWHRDECAIYSRTENVPVVRADNAKQLAYCVVLPLRAFLLRATDRKRYDAIDDMESHAEKNRESPVYAMYGASLVAFLARALQDDDLDGERVLRICSIFDTNCFEVRSADGAVNVRALYPDANLIAHDCKHNTKHNFHGDDHAMIVTATEDIAKGRLLTTTYTQTLWGTLARRAHLRRVKFFDCTCDRCRDPTEFGTYAGSIYCVECKTGKKYKGRDGDGDEEVVPKMISADPLDPNAEWRCEECDHTIAGKQIVGGNESIRREILNMDKSHPRNLEEFLVKYEDLLHPTNYHVLEIKYALTQLYGNVDGFNLLEMNDKCLQRKIDLCHELLEIADILAPGYSRFRGNLLYDLQAAMVVQAKRDYENERITKEATKEIITEATVLLQESANVLKTEPGMSDILQQRIEAMSTLLNEID